MHVAAFFILFLFFVDVAFTFVYVAFTNMLFIIKTPRHLEEKGAHTIKEEMKLDVVNLSSSHKYANVYIETHTLKLVATVIRCTHNKKRKRN